MAPQVTANTVPGQTLAGVGAGMTLPSRLDTGPTTNVAGTPDLGQLSQLAQASQPGLAQTPQAADPLAQQAQALQQQITQMMAPQPRPTLWQSILQGAHNAALVGMVPPGENPGPTVMADLARQQQAQQQAITDRVSLLNQIRQQQATQAQRAIEQQRADIEAGQLASQEALRKETAVWREAEAQRADRQASMNQIKEVPAGGKLVVFDKDGKVLQTIEGTPKTGTTGPTVKYDNGIPVSINRGTEEYTIGDPNMPPELQGLATSALNAHKQRLTEQANIADQLNKNQEARAEAAAQRNQAIKNSEAPEPVKTGLTNAYLTQDTLNDVQDMIRAYPDIIGPAIGQMEKAYQKIGTSFGFQDPNKEKAAAQLSKNLADLVVNEARTASPTRSSKELLDIVKSSSAGMAQNPQILQGFLAGAQQGVDRNIRVAQQWGITPGGQSVTAPRPGGTTTGQFSVTDPSGKAHSFDTQAQLDEFKRRTGLK